MVKYENECMGCTSIGLHCIGSSCRNRNVPHFYCDECGEEEELYVYILHTEKIRTSGSIKRKRR